MFYLVILPVVSVFGTSVIAITSPEDDTNWFSRIIRFTDESGDPLVFSHSFIPICKDCRRLSPQEMVMCNHKQGGIPKHKEKGKIYKFRSAYDQEGLIEKDLQENWGEITRSANCAFNEIYVNLMMKSFIKRIQQEDIQYNIKRIHVCIDPNGGGKNRTAIVIGYLNERTGNIVVSIR